MAQQATVVTSLPSAANVAPTDQVLVIYNANNINSNASLRLINVANFSANLTILASTPANSSSNGIQGNMSYDTNYLYVCSTNNHWLRVGLSSF
jgi:hypothetical protein